MARHNNISGMAKQEKIAGSIVLVIYLFVLPQMSDALFDWAQRMLRTSWNADQRSALYYYVLFVLTLIAFRGCLGRFGKDFFRRAASVLVPVFTGLIAFYGLNALVNLGLEMAAAPQVNLNDQAIISRIVTAPRGTILIVVLLAPIVEETLFRGLLFGNIREYSRAAAYLVSGALFAFMHVWPYFAGEWTPALLLTAAQYFVPSLVMAWTYERTENLWGSILLHCAVNGIAVLNVI